MGGTIFRRSLEGPGITPLEATMEDVPAPIDIQAIYSDHAPFIGRLIRRLTGDGPHTDDLLQETFIVLSRKPDALADRSAARPFLYGIARRLCMRHNRASRRLAFFRDRLSAEPQRAGGTEPPDEGIERRERAAAVRAVMESLPLKQREVFVLFELEGLDGQAIAELVGIPVNTVWTRLHQARTNFQTRMRKRMNREAA